jgi:hypothetical protein
MKLIEHAGLRPLGEAAPAGRRGTAAELTGGQQPVGAGYLAASCDLRVLMDQPTHSIPSHNPASRRKDCWLSDPSGGACLRRGVGGARCNDRHTRPARPAAASIPKISIRSSSSRRTVPAHRSA